MFDILKYIGYRLYSVLARVLPLWTAYGFGDFIGYLVFRLEHKDSQKRACVMQKIYKGRIDFNSAYKLVCKNIQLFNRDMVDFFRSGRLNKNNIDTFVKMEGLEHIDTALKEKKGVIFASAHMGSWEMSGIVSGLKGYSAYGMVWEIGNKRVAGMFQKIRARKGVGTVKSSSLRHILELLQKNKIIGIMLDVDGGVKGISYSLWGYNVRLPRGPIAISKDTGAKLLIVITTRNAKGGYNFYIEKPDTIGTDGEITIRMFEIIKKYIENDPVQWHWIKYFFEYTNAR